MAVANRRIRPVLARLAVLLMPLLLVPAGCNGDADGDGFADSDDCAPENASVYPGAWEACDGLDNNCDGLIDDPYDQDGDGFLADTGGCRTLGLPLDCDDGDAGIHPGAEEIDDERDNDCNGLVDDGTDGDGDGFGPADDCDDDDPFIHPGAPEVCDALDNNCDGLIDETWDEDGDGASPCAGDCDDTDPGNSGHLPEICDGRDNDCDGSSDEGFDQDGDGFTTCRGDCDDSNAMVSPARQEICGDGIDNDCNPLTSELTDEDGDGLTYCDGDCDDSDPDTYPGAVESCDGADNNCDGAIDEPIQCWDCATLQNYLICRENVTWSRARDACRDFGGELVALDDAAENTLVANLSWNFYPSTYWIGLTDQAQEDVWLWSDGTPATFFGWAPGEPNDSGGEDCVHINFSAVGLWNDLPCNLEQRFICEF